MCNKIDIRKIFLWVEKKSLNRNKLFNSSERYNSKPNIIKNVSNLVDKFWWTAGENGQIHYESGMFHHNSFSWRQPIN